MVGRMNQDDFAIARSHQRLARGVDRNAVPHHFLGKHRVRHRLDRHQIARHRRKQSNFSFGLGLS
jgi:hypothetical protein